MVRFLDPDRILGVLPDYLLGGPAENARSHDLGRITWEPCP